MEANEDICSSDICKWNEWKKPRTLNNLFLRYSRDDVTFADAESPNNKSVAIIDVLLHEKWKWRESEIILGHLEFLMANQNEIFNDKVRTYYFICAIFKYDLEFSLWDINSDRKRFTSRSAKRHLLYQES